MCVWCDHKDRLIEKQKIQIDLLEEIHEVHLKVIGKLSSDIKVLTGDYPIKSNPHMRIVR